MACEGNTCGTGGWGGPLPGDPDNTSTLLTATPAFGGIDIRWNYPTTNPHAVSHVLLYRSAVNDWNASIHRATVAGDFFYDAVETEVLYFYWIRIVSINGTVGDPIGPASSFARSTIEGLIEELTGKIDAGVLAAALKLEIERIPVIDLKIFDEIADRIAANVALGSALSAVQADLGDALTLVSQEITQRTEGETALITAINTVAAGNNTNAAAIISEQNIRITADTALGTRIDTTYAQLTNETQTKITAAVLVETTARVAQDNAMASQITALQVQVGTDITAAIQNEATVRANADAATALTISTMASQISGNSAAIQSEVTARTTAVSAETTSRNTQFASVAPAIATAIGTEVAARDGAIGTAIAGEAAARNTAITAAVLTETNARASADAALASAITTAQSTLQGNITSAQTTLQTNINTTNGVVTAIGALYTAKVTVNGLIGGFGVYNNGTEVEAGFDVDTFWVGRTSANKRKPFIIVGSETFIDEAVINKLTFNKLRSDDGSVIVENGKLKVAYLDADNIVAKQINVNNGIAGQPRTIMTNGLIQVLDGNNVVRVRLGVW